MGKGSKYADDEDDADALLDQKAIADSDPGSADDDNNEEQEQEETPRFVKQTEPLRKPGKQPGDQRFGRVKNIPLHEQEHHHPNSCACCGQAFSDEQNGIVYTVWLWVFVSATAVVLLCVLDLPSYRRADKNRPWRKGVQRIVDE